jgi:hypothetical protein
VDRDAIARSQRRRQIEEALADEQRRELVLAERLEEVVTELEGARVDAEVFGRMEPEHVALVREVLDAPALFEDGDDQVELDDGADDDAEAEAEAEIVRLQSELTESRRRQVAYQRYVDALSS